MDISATFRALMAACLLLISGSAGAALYEPDPANFGTVEPSLSDCDDCASAAVAFGGGHTLNYFGTTYSGLYVGSNGYVTFGSPQTAFTPVALNVQTLAPMIAGLLTDLDSQSDLTSNVYINTATAGQIIVTWVSMGHCCYDYSTRSTFQLVIRSDQFPVPPGEGRIGFFYRSVGDPATASAGFGDGLATINAGEQAIYMGPGTGLSNRAGSWFSLGAGGVPVVPVVPVVANPVPTLSEWGVIFLSLAILVLSLRRQSNLGAIAKPCCATS